MVFYDNRGVTKPGVIEMVQQGKAPSAKPEFSSWYSLGRKRELTPLGYPLTSVCAPCCPYMCVHTPMINKYNFVKLFFKKLLQRRYKQANESSLKKY